MRSLRPALALAFFVSIAAFAKEKPRITIQIVSSGTSQRQYTYTTPGRNGTSQTNCATNGTTNGTINDYGVGPIQTQSSGSANTNCTTTTTPAAPPQTHVRTTTQEYVSAIMPDGRHVILWRPVGFGLLQLPSPGSYEAEIEGNSLIVFVHELSGKERKIKYRSMSVEGASTTAPSQLLSDASPPQQTNSAITSQAQDAEAPKEQSPADSPETQFDLGAMYETGRGVPQDYGQAVLWYRKAAEQGDAKAEYRLGVLYANGAGVPQDKTQAAGLFLAAAKQGYAPAYAMIGGAYLTGDGVPIDYAEASFWFAVATVTESQPTLAKADAMQLRVAGLHLSQTDLSGVTERARKWLAEHPANAQ